MAKKINKDINKNLSETLNEMEVVKEAKKTNKKTVSKTSKTSKKVDTIIQEEIEVKFKLLNDDAVLPSYAHPGDIGMDVVATDVEYNVEHDYYIYHTGLACEAEEGIAQFLLMRSSVSNVSGRLCNGVGLVDPFTYRGEICFRFKNEIPLWYRVIAHATIIYNNFSWFKKLRYSFDSVCNEVEKQIMDIILDLAPYKKGDRIGQLVHVRTPVVKITEVDELSETIRGEGGFGSSGK